MHENWKMFSRITVPLNDGLSRRIRRTSFFSELNGGRFYALAVTDQANTWTAPTLTVRADVIITWPRSWSSTHAWRFVRRFCSWLIRWSSKCLHSSRGDCSPLLTRDGWVLVSPRCWWGYHTLKDYVSGHPCTACVDLRLHGDRQLVPHRIVLGYTAVPHSNKMSCPAELWFDEKRFNSLDITSLKYSCVWYLFLPRDAADFSKTSEVELV